MLECVINISEGSDASVIAMLAEAAQDSLLDVHSDKYHHRSVYTLYGPGVYQSAVSLTEKAFELLDIREHIGVHPRIGVVDVVPFVPIGDTDMAEALRARQRYAFEISLRFQVPIFLYGPERTLPQIRRDAFKSLNPDFGPPEPHPRYGSIAVGARDLLVAYNLYLVDPDLDIARVVAKQVRCHHFRTLALKVGNEVQVSANLIDPLNHGIYEFYRAASGLAEISHGELVGLAPLEVVEGAPRELWEILNLNLEKTIEVRASKKYSGPPV